MLLSGFLGSSRGVESVTILIICFFSSFLEKNIFITFPYDLLILSPSVPGTTATLSTIFSFGSLKTSFPYVSLNLIAISLVISTCCFWSFPTGTISGSYISISAAINIGYVNNPMLGLIPFAILSLYE